MSNKLLLVVFGATGNQGGSVVRYVLNTPALAAKFRVRAISRDASKPASQALKALGTEVISADASKPDTLHAALQGAHTTFITTTTTYGEGMYENEYAQGKAMTDVAVAAGVAQIIFSTLPNIEKLSGGKYRKGKHFDVKADLEQYIRSQPVKTAFFSPGSFMQNFLERPPRAVDGQPGVFALAGCVAGDSHIPLIDIATDTGKWVASALLDPERYDGAVFSASTRVYTRNEITDIMSKATGQKVVYQQLPVHVFKSFMPSDRADQLEHMFLHQEEFGYYGQDQARLIASSNEHAHSPPTTLEDFLKANPLKLETQ